MLHALSVRGVRVSWQQRGSLRRTPTADILPSRFSSSASPFARASSLPRRADKRERRARFYPTREDIVAGVGIDCRVIDRTRYTRTTTTTTTMKVSDWYLSQPRIGINEPSPRLTNRCLFARIARQLIHLWIRFARSSLRLFFCSFFLFHFQFIICQRIYLYFQPLVVTELAHCTQFLKKIVEDHEKTFRFCNFMKFQETELPVMS